MTGRENTLDRTAPFVRLHITFASRQYRKTHPTRSTKAGLVCDILPGDPVAGMRSKSLAAAADQPIAGFSEACHLEISGSPSAHALSVNRNPRLEIDCDDASPVPVFKPPLGGDFSARLRPSSVPHVRRLIFQPAFVLHRSPTGLAATRMNAKSLRRALLGIFDRLRCRIGARTCKYGWTTALSPSSTICGRPRKAPIRCDWLAR